MKYHDYYFDIDNHGNLWMDEELEFERFFSNHGDCYQLQKHGNRAVFIKLRKPYNVVPFPPGPESYKEVDL